MVSLENVWWGPADPAEWPIGLDGLPADPRWSQRATVPLSAIAGTELPPDDMWPDTMATDDVSPMAGGVPLYSSVRPTTTLLIPHAWTAARVRSSLVPMLCEWTDFDRIRRTMPTAVLRYGPESITPRDPAPDALTWLPTPEGCTPVDEPQWSLVLDLLDVEDLSQVPTSITALRIAMREAGSGSVFLHVLLRPALISRGFDLLPLAVGFRRPDPPRLLGGFSSYGALDYGEALAGAEGRDAVQQALDAGWALLVSTPSLVEQAIALRPLTGAHIDHAQYEALARAASASREAEASPVWWPYCTARDRLVTFATPANAWATVTAVRDGTPQVIRGQEQVALWLARLSPALRTSLLNTAPALALSAAGFSATFDTSEVLDTLQALLAAHRLPPERLMRTLPAHVQADPRTTEALERWLAEGFGGPAMRPQLWWWAAFAPVTTPRLAAMAAADVSDPRLPAETRVPALHWIVEHAEDQLAQLGMLLSVVADDRRVHARALVMLARLVLYVCMVLRRVPPALRDDLALAPIVTRLEDRITAIVTVAGTAPPEAWPASVVRDFCEILCWLIASPASALFLPDDSALRSLRREVSAGLPQLLRAPAVISKVCALATVGRGARRVLDLLTLDGPFDRGPARTTTARLALAVALRAQRTTVRSETLSDLDALTMACLWTHAPSDREERRAALEDVRGLARSVAEQEVCDAWLAEIETDPTRPASRVSAPALEHDECVAVMRALLQGAESTGTAAWPTLSADDGAASVRAYVEALRCVDDAGAVLTLTVVVTAACREVRSSNAALAVLMRMSGASGAGRVALALLHRGGSELGPALLEGYARAAELTFVDLDRVASGVWTVVPNGVFMTTCWGTLPQWFRSRIAEITAGRRRADRMLSGVRWWMAEHAPWLHLEGLLAVADVVASGRATAAERVFVADGIRRLEGPSRGMTALRVAARAEVRDEEIGRALLEVIHDLDVLEGDAWEADDDVPALVAGYRRIVAVPDAGELRVMLGDRESWVPVACARVRALRTLVGWIVERETVARMQALEGLAREFPWRWEVVVAGHRGRASV